MGADEHILEGAIHQGVGNSQSNHILINIRLLQLGDSALPVGGYSHSWGLEAAVDQGLVRDAPGLERWVRSWLAHAVAPFDGVVVAEGCRAAAREDWPRLLHANDLLWAGVSPPTLRHASRDMGEQLLALADVWPWASATTAELRRVAAGCAEFGGWHHAVVFGTLAAAAGAETAEAVAVYLHQAALGAIGAGVRAVPIGHTHGQQVLAYLHDHIRALADEAARRDLDAAGSFSPAYEVLCHAQSQLYTRLFRS
jgi:urease accessory protein